MAMIFVIPGHGAGDPGAYGNGYDEAERVRALASAMKELGGSDVELADFDRNYFSDGGIIDLSLDKSTQIVELHMDCASADAHGGHVLIKPGFKPDEYDNALADFISGFFPGRSEKLRTQPLSNATRAASKGYGYRLIECGFITNAGDIAKFNDGLPSLASGILECFGIKAVKPGIEVETPKPVIQEQPKTVITPECTSGNWVSRLQAECNAQGFSNQKVDGEAGTVTLAGCPTLRRGSRGNITALVQERLNLLGFACGNVDGVNGTKTQNGIRAFQIANGLEDDGVVGKKTWAKLLGL